MVAERIFSFALLRCKFLVAVKILKPCSDFSACVHVDIKPRAQFRRSEIREHFQSGEFHIFAHRTDHRSVECRDLLFGNQQFFL